MSNELTNQQRYDALVSALRIAVADADLTMRAPLRPATIDGGERIPAETKEDRAAIAYDELWSALSAVMVEHTIPTATDNRDESDRSTIAWIATVVNMKRHADGMAPLHNGARIPLIGTVIDDPKLGNRVILNGNTHD